MKKKYMLAVSAATLLSISATTYGEELGQIKERYEEINSQKAVVEKQLESNSDMKNRAEEELKELEKDMASISGELRDTEKGLETINKKMSESKSDLEKAEKKLADKQNLLASRLNTMYKNSSASYLEVILGSRNMIDLFDRLDMVKNIVSYDKDIIEEVEEKKEEIVEATKKLEHEEAESKKMAKSLEQKKVELSNVSKSKEAIMSSLEKNENEYKAEIESLSSESNRALVEVRKKETEIAQKEASLKAAEQKAADQKAAELAKKNIAQSSSNSQKPDTETTSTQQQGSDTVASADKSNLGEAMVMKATAYDPFPAGGSGGITAMGTVARVGVIAVDPRVIPLGTRVYMEHMDGTPMGYYVAEDTGGDIKGNRIDILFMTKAEAFQFGVKNVKLYIVN